MQHLARRRPSEQERTLQVRVHHPVPLFLGHVDDRRVGIDGGIVDGHVQPVVRLNRLRDRGVDRCRIAHINL